MYVIERPLSDGPEFKSGPNKGSPIPNNPGLIVIHAMAEYILDPEPIFAANFLEKIGLSAHALIVPNGDVMICRDTSSCAHHALGFNIDSLGIEFLVPGSHNYGSFIETIRTDWATDAQYKAGIELVTKWKNEFHIKSDNIKRHSDISPGRKVDPGAGFKWDYFKSKLEG